MKTKTLALISAALLLVGGVAAQTNSNSNGPDLQPVLINTDPVPVQSGEDAEITFKIRNNGNSAAEDVEIGIVDSYPFSLKPDRKRTYAIGDIASGQRIQLPTYEVLVAEDAPDGVNDLKIRVTHGDVSYTREIPVTVQSQDIKINLANLQTVPSQLTPDTENAKMVVEAVNNGEKTAENAVVNIQLPETFQATSSFSTRQAIGNIGPGQVKQAEFTFDIEKDAEKGTVHIPSDITYSTGESSARVTENTDFSFFLAGKPQFEVVKVESNLETDSTSQLRITVQNTGSEKASSTRIRVLDSSDLPFSYGSASHYIGTLEPGQNGTAVFDVTAENSAEVKNYLLDFEVRGVKDSTTYVEETTVSAEVQQGTTESGLPVMPIAVIVVLGAGAVIFRNRIKGLF
ncbi:COG1361 S-layer family protein [Candidatus Nanohalovita haloferacivicina]|uniref:COG1361 S-layer family protein n=1 Tax=Candidatus Nanohalovita haloferacivicina TaxID=2978046 RepID=UPI00325FD1FB|nr:S-layer protein, possibly associated with type IV pili like system [Candidatus Nanohalobia archaeon BNXNv]